MKVTISPEQANSICDQIIEIAVEVLSHVAKETTQFTPAALTVAANLRGFDEPLAAWCADDDFLDCEELSEFKYEEIVWSMLAHFTSTDSLCDALDLFLNQAGAFFQVHHEEWKARIKQTYKSEKNLKNSQKKFTYEERAKLKVALPAIRIKHSKWSAEALGRKLFDTGDFSVSASTLAKKIRELAPDLPKTKAGRPKRCQLK